MTPEAETALLLRVKNLDTRLKALEMGAGLGGAIKYNPKILEAEGICAFAMGGSLPSRWAEGIGRTFKIKGLEWFERYVKPGVPEKAHEAAQSWKDYKNNWPVAWGVVVWYIEQEEYAATKPEQKKPSTGYPAAVPDFEALDKAHFEEMRKRNANNSQL